MDAAPDRRTVLRAAGAITGAAGTAALLAACSPGGSGGGSGSGAEAGSSGEAIVAAADVPVGGAVAAMSGRAQVIVAQPSKGEFVGLSAVCPHQGCAVRPADAELDCPCHGSRFALDGSLLQGPATEGLEPFAVRLDGDQVVVD